MNIPTDFYYPSNSNIDNFKEITILILQGVDLDQKEYENFAQLLAKKGYRVLIPNFYQKGGYLCPDHNSLKSFFQEINHFKPDFFPEGYIRNNLIIFGHSAGGVAILQSLHNLTDLPLGIILYGCYPSKPAINSSSIPPILVMAGDQDDIAKPEIIKSHFTDNLLGNLNFFLELDNFDHFTINNSSDPWHKQETNPSRRKQKQENIDDITKVIDKFSKGCIDENFDNFQELNLSCIQQIIFKKQLKCQ